MEPVEVWKDYWESQNLNGGLSSVKLSLSQVIIFSYLENIVETNRINSILSAGAGQDIICYNLQKRFKNELKLTVLDVSKKVLEWNRKLFRTSHLNAQFIEADIFKLPFKDESFNLVFNTGVLEHYEKERQISMMREILRVLKPSGYFITANPSDNGKIYKLGMKIAKEKNIWPFGQEIPIKSLRFLKKEISQIDYIQEWHRDFLTQLLFLDYINPSFGFFTLPIRKFGKLSIIYRICDLLFSKFLGTYLLISIIKKKERK